MSVYPSHFSDQTNHPPDELVTYTVVEVAELLKINKRTVYRYIETGELKTFRLGKSVRIRKQDLVEFIESHL